MSRVFERVRVGLKCRIIGLRGIIYVASSTYIKPVIYQLIDYGVVDSKQVLDRAEKINK